MPQPTLYVGTRNGISVYQLGAGDSLQRILHTLDGAAVTALVVIGGATLLATVDGAAQQSFDGGATWNAASVAAPEAFGVRVATRHGPQVLANPRLAGATAYARLDRKPAVLIGAGAGGMMLFHSADDGIHWSPAGMVPAGNITTIIPDGVQSHVAWAGSDKGALLRSDDGGKNWQIVAREAIAVLCLARVH